MSIKDEFTTVDVILTSNAETLGVDAFALSLIKAERQMRRLFTYLVFQSDAFDDGNVRDLQDMLAKHKNVYFEDFILAWDKLYVRPLKEIVGPDYNRLQTVLDKAKDAQKQDLPWPVDRRQTLAVRTSRLCGADQVLVPAPCGRLPDRNRL